MFRWNIANFAWFVAYLATMGAVVFGIDHYRQTAMVRYGSKEAGDKWQDWRVAADEMGSSGPISRRKPKSVEPPPLVLMRDYYPACLGISLLLSSCLFVWFMISARGAMKPIVLHDDE